MVLPRELKSLLILKTENKNCKLIFIDGHQLTLKLKFENGEEKKTGTRNRVGLFLAEQRHIK